MSSHSYVLGHEGQNMSSLNVADSLSDVRSDEENGGL